MAKKSSFTLRKKDYPGLIRVTENGQRVWKYQGNTYATKRELYEATKK